MVSLFPSAPRIGASCSDQDGAEWKVETNVYPGHVVGFCCDSGWLRYHNSFWGILCTRGWFPIAVCEARQNKHQIQQKIGVKTCNEPFQCTTISRIALAQPLSSRGRSALGRRPAMARGSYLSPLLIGRLPMQ